MLASPQIKTVKPPEKKPGISEWSSFLRRRSVKFQFVWQKLCCNIPLAGPLSSTEASLWCEEAGEEEKESARGTMGRGEREERPLPNNVRFTGRICGSIVLAKPADYLDAFKSWLTITPFPSFHRPPRAFYFLYYSYFLGIPQREPLRRRECVLYLF